MFLLVCCRCSPTHIRLVASIYELHNACYLYLPFTLWFRGIAFAVAAKQDDDGLDISREMSAASATVGRVALAKVTFGK